MNLRRLRLLAVLVAVAIGLVVSLVGNDHPVTWGEPNLTPGTVTTDATGGRDVVVVFDGWSVATLADRRLAVTVAGATTRTALVAGTTEHLEQLAEASTDAVTLLAARLASADTGLLCDTDGCRDGAGTITFDQLAAPATLTHLGPVHAAAGVTTGVWLLPVHLPTGQNRFAVAVAGLAGSEAVFSLTDANDARDTAKVAATGFATAAFVAGAAFGRIFPLEHAWTDTRRLAFEYRPVAGYGKARTTHPLFDTGLAIPVPYAATLTDTQLFFLSSPSTGCGFGVLCTPKAIVDVTDGPTRTFDICGPKTTGERFAVTVTDTRWTFTGTDPLHQGGAWGGTDPARFAHADTITTPWWDGQAPLFTAPGTLRVLSIYTWDRVGLRDVGGWVLEVGKDDKALLAASTDALITKLYAQSNYRRC